ncbi:MAG: thiamine pyrophosphate-dependent enzyme [bacterium]|nr:thiamine pyrophosphate-dependent enzyme [bacterium]
MQKEILKNKGEKVLLLGNEAIVRGALEAGVQFISTYPGTPASEIGNIFYDFSRFSKIAKNFYFEFSVNEKIALEAGAGASFCGLRSLVAMKNFGLNVASDFLYPLVYSGVKGGLVIVVADDPSCWSSAQSEDNSRGHILKAHIPTLEPSTPQECKEFTKLAFELSEKFKIPVMIRETTRVALQSGLVNLGEIKKENRKAQFIKNPRQFVTMPPRVLEMHRELLDKIEAIREKVSEKSPLNFVEGRPAKIGVITSGVGYLYAEEALKELKLELPILKLGFFYPLPEKKIKNFIKNLNQVLIIEELEPYLEKEVERLAKEGNPKLKINGKNFLPEVGEIKPEDVISAISKLSGKKTEFDFKKHRNEFEKIKFPERKPRFCQGCPYNFVFSTLKRIAPKNTVFGGEIGCYMLAHYPPYETQDYLYCMGSDISIAHGIEKAAKQKVITFVGDSSFFHASIPALINTVFNKSNPLIVILDNGTTAMTGHQPNPGVAGLKIEEIVRACGVKNVKIVDPVKMKEFENTVKDFLKKKEVSVIIARHPCLFINK